MRCAARYTYVFTTGGIGPTHDDITADAVAKAFGVPIDRRPARRRDAARALSSRSDLNEARLRMARIPQGADSIENPISKAPGFRIGNVIVMAGVPSIMQAMLDARGADGSTTGARMLVETVDAGEPAGGPLCGRPRRRSPAAMPACRSAPIPSFAGAGFRNQIVRARARTRCGAAAAAAVDARARRPVCQRRRARRASEPGFAAS